MAGLRETGSSRGDQLGHREQLENDSLPPMESSRKSRLPGQEGVLQCHLKDDPGLESWSHHLLAAAWHQAQ